MIHGGHIISSLQKVLICPNKPAINSPHYVFSPTFSCAAESSFKVWCIDLRLNSFSTSAIFNPASRLSIMVHSSSLKVVSLSLGPYFFWISGNRLTAGHVGIKTFSRFTGVQIQFRCHLPVWAIVSPVMSQILLVSFCVLVTIYTWWRQALLLISCPPA